MSIAVAPEAQGLGAGQLLVDAFLIEASHRNLNQVVLTTDKQNNERVNLFYCKYGFKLERSFFTHEGREMNEYSFDVKNKEFASS